MLKAISGGDLGLGGGGSGPCKSAVDASGTIGASAAGTPSSHSGDKGLSSEAGPSTVHATAGSFGGVAASRIERARSSRRACASCSVTALHYLATARAFLHGGHRYFFIFINKQ